MTSPITVSRFNNAVSITKQRGVQTITVLGAMGLRGATGPAGETGPAGPAGGYSAGDSPIFTNQSLTGYLDLYEITSPATPSADHARMWVEDNNGFSVIHWKCSNSLDHEVSRDLVHVVRNTSGSTLAMGTVVYISGSTGTLPNVAPARANSRTTMPAFGIVTAAIANNSFGQVMTLGDVQGLNTSGFAAGDVIYVSDAVAGAYSATEPTGSGIDQRIGVVLRSHASQGIVGFTVGAEIDPALTQTLSNKTLASPLVTGLADYADDAAAAIGGVPVNGLYRTASVLKIRVS